MTRARQVATLIAWLLVAACSRKEPGTDAARVEPAKSAVPPASELLRAGARVPALAVTAHNGERLELATLGKPAVVYFYPKDDTPGCTTEATEIRDLWGEIGKTGAIVIGVSTDGEGSHQAFAEKYALPFLLVPDEDHRVAKAFGVAVTNGKAARVSFVVGADGVVRKVFPRVTPKGHGAELLGALADKRLR
ncbi:MAG TPA: peroxiredoxin [Polyangiaceae bacterium]